MYGMKTGVKRRLVNATFLRHALTGSQAAVLQRRTHIGPLSC